MKLEFQYVDDYPRYALEFVYVRWHCFILGIWEEEELKPLALALTHKIRSQQNAHRTQT